MVEDPLFLLELDGRDMPALPYSQGRGGCGGRGSEDEGTMLFIRIVVIMFP